MSMYHMIHGVNPLTFFVIPMLGDKHTDEYPRFRDCFIKDGSHPEYDNHIHIYTRVGGGNRCFDYGQNNLLSHPNYVATWDDEEDSTYGTYCFSVPDKWKADFAFILEGKQEKISPELQRQIDKVFPKLKGKLPWHDLVEEISD